MRNYSILARLTSFATLCILLSGGKISFMILTGKNSMVFDRDINSIFVSLENICIRKLIVFQKGVINPNTVSFVSLTIQIMPSVILRMSESIAQKNQT